MKDEYVQNIALRKQYDHQEYLVTLFGVSISPGVFMEYMNRIFHPYLDPLMIVCIDDILVYSKIDEDHA